MTGPQRLADLPTPALILDLDTLERNIESMSRRLQSVNLRPHFKTHKCLEIAHLQHQAGARGFTVSTLEEARLLVEAGFNDLTWAFPLILNRISEVIELERLAGEESKLHWLVDSPEALAALEHEAAPAVGRALRVWLKVDCGYHRAGVDPESDAGLQLGRRLAFCRALSFAGLLSHSGHGYQRPGRDWLLAVHEEERSVMTGFAAKLRAHGAHVPAISIGSTPTLSVAEEFTGVTEARPGNYVFYDLTQVALGSCSVSDCAVTVEASVVSSHGHSKHSIIDAGALSLSSDPGPSWVPGTYGGILDYPKGQLEPDACVVSLSQEHGKVNAALPVGSRVRILPNHSCLTVAHFDHYEVVRGNRVVDRWPINKPSARTSNA